MSNLREIFYQSYDRVVSVRIDGDNYLSHFYKTFPKSDPLIQEKFAKTDFEALIKMVHKSINLMIKFSDNYVVSDDLRRVALIHRKEHLDIQPHMYNLWMNALLNTVSEFDPGFDDEVALSWKLAMSPGITYLIHSYELKPKA